MTNIERINKYKLEHCTHCKNKESDVCNIVIFRSKDVVYTKCAYYVKDDISTCIKTKCGQCRYYSRCFYEGKIK